MTRVELVVVVAVVVHAVPARAQSAEAEVLFRDGRALIKEGQLAEGCAKLEASQRFESSVGTLLNLGDCREKLGKPASAWLAFRKAEDGARHARHDDKRADEAHRRAEAIEPFMPSLALEVTEVPDGLVIRRDGEVIDPVLYGSAVPIDPGSYVITAEAPDRAPWRSLIVVQYKTQRKVTIPALERAKRR